jgi:hypothetical protein
VLFDINRHAAVKSTLLVSDPAPFTDRLLAESDLPFAVTIITNESAESVAVVAWRKAPHELETSLLGPLGLAWPGDVVSLSHVALPISPNDPLYGRFQPLESNHIFLGNLAIKGERGLLKIPEGWLLRMRNNPFYSYLEDSVLGWLEEGSKKSRD